MKTITAAEYKALVRESWSEAEFQQQVIDFARPLGYVAAHFRAVRVQRADGSVYYATPVQVDGEGWPDLFLVRERDGRELVMELKVKRNKPTAAQEKWLRLLDRPGRRAYVFYPKDWDEIVRVLSGV